MSKKKKETDFLSISARVRVLETRLLTAERMERMIEARDAAEAANEALLPLMNGLFETSNPILVKEALSLVGFPVGGVRLPLVDATPEQSKRLAAIMREVGVLD